MVELEYIDFQHSFQDHIEAQAADEGSSRQRLNQPSYIEDNLSKNLKNLNDRTAHISPSVLPLCQPDVSSSEDVHCSFPESDQGLKNVQESKTIQHSDSTSNVTEVKRTPSSCGEVPSPVMAKARFAVKDGRGAELHNHDDALPFKVRPNPPARLCLEKRFDATRQQESQTVILNAFLSVLHSTDVQGIAGQAVTSECFYPCGEDLSNNLVPSCGQASKYPDVTGLGNVTFSNKPEQTESVLRVPCITHINTTDQHHIAKNNRKAAGKAAPSASHTRKGCRRAVPCIDIIQRRQRHNSQERDRRKRIRLCCDELNLLVPFCCANTDRATTLQWTTAFLKYIREVCGESLKQEFESAFCDKTGIQVKPGCDAAVHQSEPCKDIPEHGCSVSLK